MKLFQIRPTKLKEFQGKNNLKKNLGVYIESALKRNEQLDHCLFYGPAGVGKTSLAYIIAFELKQKIKVVQGPEIQEKTDILNLLYCLQDKSILFIDEIHAINPKCFEILYSAMEDFKINIEVGKEFNKKTTFVNVPKFTLIGATTKLGNLPSPFEERFGIIFNIAEYTPNEIYAILKFSLSKINIELDKKIIETISLRSKGIPRIAKRNLSRYLDHYLINQQDSEAIWKQIGVFDNGLEEIDINYLKCINNNKKLSLKSLAQLLNIDEKTLIEKIEPYLMKCDYIQKTLNGRILTNKGIEFINKFK